MRKKCLILLIVFISSCRGIEKSSHNLLCGITGESFSNHRAHYFDCYIMGDYSKLIRIAEIEFKFRNKNWETEKITTNRLSNSTNGFLCDKSIKPYLHVRRSIKTSDVISENCMVKVRYRNGNNVHISTFRLSIVKPIIIDGLRKVYSKNENIKLRILNFSDKNVYHFEIVRSIRLLRNVNRCVFSKTIKTNYLEIDTSSFLRQKHLLNITASHCSNRQNYITSHFSFIIK